MAGVFISYRRGDGAGFAGRLYDRLAEIYPADRIFLDVDNLTVGQDFVGALEEKVHACDVFLCIIGPAWLEAEGKDGRRRLDNPDDFVRLEIETALAAGKLVAPILIDDAVMPRRDQLPESLHALTRRHALRISHESFSSDTDQLIRSLGGVIPAPAGASAERQQAAAGAAAGPAARVRLPFLLGGALAVTLVALAVAVWLLVSSSQEAVDRALDYAQAWQADEYRDARGAIDARIGYLNGLYAAELPPDATEAERAAYRERLGVEAMTPEGGSMPFPEFRTVFDRVMDYLNRASTCANAGVCDRATIDQYMLADARSFWGYFAGYARNRRTAGEADYARPLEDYLAATGR